jgi:hypothetical protein
VPASLAAMVSSAGGRSSTRETATFAGNRDCHHEAGRLDQNGDVNHRSGSCAWWPLAALAILIAACGPDPLSHVGEGSSDWIEEPTVSTVASTQAGGSSLAPVVGSDWFNNDLAPVGGTSPAEIISGVYTRANSSDPFVQATPSEIALALPGVVFPSLTPPDVRYITSQLVFDLNNTTLAKDQVAAFGLWSVEPYTRSRSVGQQGVFSVIPDAEGLAAIASGTADTSCARFLDQNVECAVQEVSTNPAWELTDQLGTTLIWYGDSYRYELFLRSGIAPGLAIEMAESVRPLEALAR